MAKIATYGTLQPKFGRINSIIGVTPKELGQVELDGTLYLQRWFPCLALPSSGSHVAGTKVLATVVEVPDKLVKHLDNFEGSDHDFFRKTTIQTKFGDTLVYHWPHDVENFPRISEFSGGDQGQTKAFFLEEVAA